MLWNRPDPRRDIRVVNGEEIRHWYHEDNHSQLAQRGGLHNSSMKHAHMQPFFDLYTRNPDTISMLIETHRDDDDVERLVGRALVWTTEGGHVCMDNIYADREAAHRLLHEALSCGFAWLPMSPYVYNVRLQEWDFDLYPYVDTMSFLCEDEQGWYLSNHFDPNSEGTVYQLSSHEGWAWVRRAAVGAIV